MLALRCKRPAAAVRDDLRLTSSLCRVTSNSNCRVGIESCWRNLVWRAAHFRPGFGRPRRVLSLMSAGECSAQVSGSTFAAAPLPSRGGPEHRHLEPDRGMAETSPRAPDPGGVVNARQAQLSSSVRVPGGTSDDSAAIGKRPGLDHLAMMGSLQLADRKRLAVAHEKAIDVFEIENIPPDAERKPILTLA